LIGDIAVLLDAGEDEATAAPSGGRWLGSQVDAQDDGKPLKLVNVRTWIGG
jgi:hypothetical protein